MYQIPKCRFSHMDADRLCIAKTCQEYPFICSNCPNKNCEYLHKHANEYKTIDQNDLVTLRQQIREKSQVSTKKINPGILKKLQNLSNAIIQIKQKYENSLKDYQNKVQKAKGPAKTFSKLERQDFESLTGGDIYELKNVINTNQYFINKKKIDQKYEEEAYQLKTLIQSLENQMQKYFNQQNIDLDVNPDQNQNQIIPYWNLAVNNQNLQKYNEAEKYYLKIIKINPNFDTLHPSYKDFNVYFNLAVVYHKQQKFDKALEFYTKAIQKTPTHSRALLNTAIIYINQNKLEEAITTYSDYLKINPGDAQIRHKRGILYTLLNNFQAAQKDFSEAIKLDKNKFAYYENRAKTYKQLNQTINALADFAKALQLNPNNQEIYYQIAITYHNDKKFEDALKNYNQVLRLNPNNFNAKHYRALVHINLDHYSQAIKDLTQYANVSPTADIYNKLGELYLRLNDYNKAIQNYQKSISINQKDDKVYFNAAFAYKHQNQMGEADQMIDKAIELCPQREQYKEFKVLLQNSKRLIRRLTIKNKINN